MKINKLILKQNNKKFWDTYEKVDKLFVRHTKIHKNNYAKGEFYNEFNKLRDLWMWLHNQANKE